MTGSLNFPVFLYSLLGMLALGTFLTEARYGPQTAILICGFYLAAAYLQKWFFDSNQMFRKKTRSEAIEQIIFAGEPVETEAVAALEKRTLDKVLKLPVQIKLRIGMFGMVGLCVSLVLNHTLQMHFTLFFHLITALLILPAMTPNHFMLPCAVNLMAVVYGYTSSDTPDAFLYSVYVLLFMFVVMSFGNVQRETKQTQAKPIAVTQLTVRTLVSAVQTGVAYLLLMGIVDYFVPHPGKTRQQQRAGIKSTMVQFQSMLGRAMPDSFRPAPGPSGAPNPTKKEGANGMNAQPSPGGGAEIPSGTPSEGPNAKPTPSAAPSTDPSAKPSASPSGNPEKPPSPPPFPLPSALPSLSPEQIQSLAREALKQGLFDEKDLKRGELNLKPEIQKLLTPERVQQAMEQLKKMSQSSQPGANSLGHTDTRPGPDARPDSRSDLRAPAPKLDPTSAKAGAARPTGPSAQEKERQKLEQALQNILKQARTTLADNKSKPKPGGDKAKSKASSGGQDSGGDEGGGSGGARSQEKDHSNQKTTDDLFRRTKKKADAETTLDKLKAILTAPQRWASRIYDQAMGKGKTDLAAMADDLFTPILAVLVLAAVWYFRRKLRKKADPRRVSRAQLARDQRAEILARLKELASGSLSAREEVIARYDLFLKIMEFAASPRESYLPPTDFQRRIRMLHPSLEGQSKQITEIFCDVFYGDISAGKDEVSKSRGAVKEIFHYFAD